MPRNVFIGRGEDEITLIKPDIGNRRENAIIEANRRLSNAQLPKNLIEFGNNRFSNCSVVHFESIGTIWK